MTKIEWTDRTWNPVTGCNKVSQGCKNCYAEVMHRRQMAMNPHKYTKPFLHGAEVHYDELDKPLHWRKPSMVFVNSMSDLFHPGVDFQFIVEVFQIMRRCPQHTFQILTKRPEIMLEFMAWIPNTINSTTRLLNPFGVPYAPLPNVWLGVSCEDQAAADERIPLLLQVPAAVRFLSCEPLLGDLDIIRWMPHDYMPENQTGWIDWVIVGGESGHHARLMHPDWVRDIREQCRLGGVPFFFKQWGEWYPFELPDDQEGESPLGSPGWPIPADTKTAITRDRIRYVKYHKSGSGNTLDGKQHLEFPA